MPKSLLEILEYRFGDLALPDAAEPDLIGMAARGSCREFTHQPVPPDLTRMICATALSSPTKSDLQQRDIIELRSAEKRREIADLIPGQAWVSNAPTLLIFCGNNRRQRLLHDWHAVPFANDHFDTAFNAIADAAIALGAFVTAAEKAGLGCCPISAVRNEAEAVSNILCLPDHVFPFAGLAVGYPQKRAEISMRLPLSVTCHVDEYCEDGLRDAVRDYDAARQARQPYASQRLTDHFAETKEYGWSTDKTRQYSQPEREGFGAYLRKKGFDLS